MKLDTQSSIPLYEQLTSYLRQQIDAGVYTSGQKLPSERDLAQTYDVSRMTARQAIQQLVQIGIAYSRVGKGTFVRSQPINQELRELTGFTEEMGRLGARQSSRVLVSKIIAAGPTLADHLQLIEGSNVAVLQRVRLANDKPLALETSHLNLNYCPEDILINHDFSRESLYQVLRDVYGVYPMWADQIIEARLPDTYERRQLELSEYDPVLSLIRVTYDQNDAPVEFVRSSYVGEHYQLQTTLRVESKERL